MWTTAGLRKDLTAKLPRACWDAPSDGRILKSFCCLSLQYDGTDINDDAAAAAAATAWIYGALSGTFLGWP